jgi:hypothetical protein
MLGYHQHPTKASIKKLKMNLLNKKTKQPRLWWDAGGYPSISLNSKSILMIEGIREQADGRSKGKR